MIKNYSKDNLTVILDFLRVRGFNEYAVFGIVANMYAESGFRADNLQNSYESRLGMSDAEYVAKVNAGEYTGFCTDRAGFGLCQWTSSGRKTGLYNFTKQHGKSIGDLGLQLEYFWHELNTSYKNVLKALQSAQSVDEAARVVMLKFERPANQSEVNQLVRASYGMEFYERYREEGVTKMKIAIDAGHGLYTSGKRCMKKLDKNETREWYLNDRIADKLEALLESYDCEVLRVDDTTGLTDVSMANRVKKANNWGADIYISIHHNAGLNGRQGGGTVVYYYSPKAERKTQAQKLYNDVVRLTGLVGNRSSKVIKKGFYVIKNTSMPAFLIENGFMDSPTDVPIILSENHANKTAHGLLSFLVSQCRLREIKTAPSTETVSTSFKVRVTVDALNIRASAGTQHDVEGVIKDHGIYTIVETSGNWGKLKSGAGWINISSKYVSRV